MALAALADIDPDDLTPEQIDALESCYGGESFRDFMVRVAPHEPPPRHLGPLIELVERARRERIRVCFSMPPRHAKSTTLRKALAWWLTKFPRDTCAYLTYSDNRAGRESRKIRQLARAAGIAMGEADTLQEWRTREGGGLIAAGVGGALTGEGVQGIMLIDDPYKNSEDANSATYRESVREWFGEVALTRLEGGSVIALHTRWRDDDLIGWLVKENGWEYINVPAIAEPGDILGRAPGEALWPERYPIEEFDAIRAGGMTEFSFSAIYQGRPRPRGARVFGEPHYYDPATLSLNGARIKLIVDPAASEKTSADYSVLGALAVWGRGDEMTGKVIDVWRGQVEVPQLIQQIRAFRKRHGGGRIGVESVGGFKAIPQMLKAMDPELAGLIDEIVPVGDKFTRAQPAAAAWNAGRIEVPLGAPWVPAFVAELQAFTGVRDAHDDQVDFLAHGWNEALKAPAPFSRPAGVMLPRRI